MLSVFSFCVFCVWFGVFCHFFAVLLFLGSLFGKFFGSELLFLSAVVGLVFFDSVLPRFLFYYLVFRSRKCLGKILLMSGPLFEKFSGANFCFLVSVLVVFFWCCFAYVFALLFGFSLPKTSRKNSLDVRFCVSGFFGLAVRSFSGRFSGPETPLLASWKRRKEKRSPVLGFFRSSIFVTAFFGRFFVTNSVSCDAGFLWLILGVHFCMDFCLDFREFSFRRFRVPFFFALSLPPCPSSPPSLLRAGLGFFSVLLVCGPQDIGLPLYGQAGAACTCFFSVSSPLSARVGPLPPLFFRLLPSLSFSLSLACT